MISSTFNLVATHLDDDNIFTSDPSVRRHIVDGKYVYVFTNAASAQAVTTKRSLRLTDCLLVGGGGAGGTTMAGGGGGGGVTNISGIANVVASRGSTITVSVGAGGTPSTAQGVKGGNGGTTLFDFGVFSASVVGGGGGGSWDNKAGAAGASGGGGSQNGAGGEGIEGIGFAGAAGLAVNGSGSGGGGGAGHAGYTAANSRAGNGGEGVSNRITGAWVVYGGGGGGGGSGSGYGTYNFGFGGLGGGGDGGKSVVGNPGADGLGGGGGGGGWSGSLKAGGRGGSGTVILAVTPNEIETDLADQVWNHFDPCRPEITVSNVLNGATWTVGGDIESPYFDVEYRNNVGIGLATVIVTGKGDCAGLFWSGVFNIIADNMNALKNASGEYPSLGAVFKKFDIDTLRLVSVGLYINYYEDTEHAVVDEWAKTITLADPAYYNFSRLPEQTGGSYTSAEQERKTVKVNLTVTATEQP